MYYLLIRHKNEIAKVCAIKKSAGADLVYLVDVCAVIMQRRTRLR